MSLRPWPDAGWQKQSEGSEVVAARTAVESELDAGEEKGEGETRANRNDSDHDWNPSLPLHAMWGC